MKHVLAAVIGSVLLAATTPALAKSIAVPGTQLTIWAPDDFTLESGTDMLSAESKKKDAALLWVVTQAQDMAAAVAGIDAVLTKIVTDIQPGQTGKTMINGMPALLVTSTGKVEGKPVSLTALVLEAAPGKVLFTIGIVQTSKKASYKKTWKKVLAGIKKTQ